jgi:hypothetical protein
MDTESRNEDLFQSRTWQSYVASRKVEPSPFIQEKLKHIPSNQMATREIGPIHWFVAAGLLVILIGLNVLCHTSIRVKELSGTIYTSYFNHINPDK